MALRPKNAGCALGLRQSGNGLLLFLTQHLCLTACARLGNVLG